MIRVMTVFGTRPEAIKMAPLVNGLSQDNRFQSIVCVTAQHREMLDAVLELFSIIPDYDLNIMKHGQTLGEITTKVISGIDTIIREAQPDIVLVHGDTTTTFAASLAAFYNQIPVGHVEAGLRSGNIYSPYPEEMNRRLTGILANIHFAPTKGNKENLLKEGKPEENIIVTGNTVIDALFQVIEEDYKFADPVLNKIDFQNKRIIVLTAHRRENWGQPMVNIFNAVDDIVARRNDVEVVFPMHLNPKIREYAVEILGGKDRIHLIEPLSYKPFANLLNKSYLMLTDSGGIQEEAPAFGKPVLVLRTETERPEAVEAGTVKVVGVNRGEIYTRTGELLDDSAKYFAMANAVNPYGDGKATGRILNVLFERYGSR